MESTMLYYLADRLRRMAVVLLGVSVVVFTTTIAFERRSPPLGPLVDDVRDAEDPPPSADLRLMDGSRRIVPARQE